VIGTQNNVSHYEVEYSIDAVNFATIGSLHARAGTTHLTYSFLHKISNDKNSYYRIKVIDKDGEITYSAIEEVKAEKLIAKLVTYPNPTNGIFKIKIPTIIKGKFYLKVYDEAGKLVASKAMQLQQGTTETELNISRFATGNYQLVCQDDQSRFVTTILKRLMRHLKKTRSINHYSSIHDESLIHTSPKKCHRRTDGGGKCIITGKV
jgi:hypothetical protein